MLFINYQIQFILIYDEMFFMTHPKVSPRQKLHAYSIDINSTTYCFSWTTRDKHEEEIWGYGVGMIFFSAESKIFTLC